MTTNNILSFFLVPIAILGEQRKYLAPSAEHPLAGLVNTDPAKLPEVGSEEENQLVNLTVGQINASVPLGFVIPPAKEGADQLTSYNATVEEFALWLQLQAEEVSAKPTAEQVVEEIQAIAEENQAVAEAVETVTETVNEELGLSLTEEEALKLAVGQNHLKALKTTKTLNQGVAAKISSAYELLKAAMEMNEASTSVITALERNVRETAALPAEAV